MFIAALFGALIMQDQVDPSKLAGAPASDKVSKAEKEHQKAILSDIEMGKKFVIEVEKTEKISDNKEYQERVNRIGQELAAIAQTKKVDTLWGDKRLNKFDYTFKVIKGEDVNAFSLPGGFIYVYEGLVKYAESDDEIAAVLAHEISHAEERHIATLSHEANKVQTPALATILIAIATGKPDIIGPALILGTNVVQSFTSEWSVQAEKAADHGGFQYLTYSKYNPTAMLTFMERLALDDHNDPSHQLDWGIYRTHPPGKDRAYAILADMKKYDVPIQRSAVSTRFRAEAIASKDGVDMWFNKRKIYTFAGADAQSRANAATVRLNAFFDQVPNLFDVMFDGKEIVGRRVALIDVRPEDAEIRKKSIDALGQEAVAAIRGSLYNYAFSIWGTK